MSMLFLSNSYCLGVFDDPFLRIKDDFSRIFSTFDDCTRQISQSFSNVKNQFSHFDFSFDSDDSAEKFNEGRISFNLPFVSWAFQKIGQENQEIKVNDTVDLSGQEGPVSLCQIKEFADNFRKNVEVKGFLSPKDPKLLNLNIEASLEINNSKKDQSAHSNHNFSGSRSFCIKIPDGFLPKIKGVKSFDSSIELEFEKEIKSDPQKMDSMTENAENTVPSITRDLFDKNVLASQKPVIVYCYAPWSADCQAFGSLFESRAGVDLKDFGLFKIDMKEIDDLADQYKIDSIPTLLIFGDGKLLGKITREKLLKMQFAEICKKIKSLFR